MLMSRRDGEGITVRFEVLFADINAFSSMVWFVFCELECSLTVYYPVSLLQGLLASFLLSPVAIFIVKKKEKEGPPHLLFEVSSFSTLCR